MSHARVMLAMIDEFVGLAVERRERQLPPDKRERMETLDERLRETIDGAKPAPKRIANPRAVSGRARPLPGAPTPAASGNGAKATVASALDDALKIPPKDKKKVQTVATVAKSGYTPSSAPAFMHDYYSDDLVPAKITADVVPTGVSDATGESVDLTHDVKVLLGLEKPRPVAAPARGNTPVPQARAASAAKRPGTPVILHLLKGGTKRGNVEDFQPGSGSVDLLMKNGNTETIDLATVLAVFFGASKSNPPQEPHGTDLIVKLVNDRQLTGVSPDYVEGAPALTVVPNPRRGNIDHIWVPAWAVKEIELS